MTTNLVTAAARAGSPHFVQPSVVGVDAMAQWGYVKARLQVDGSWSTGLRCLTC